MISSMVERLGRPGLRQLEGRHNSVYVQQKNVKQLIDDP